MTSEIGLEISNLFLFVASIVHHAGLQNTKWTFQVLNLEGKRSPSLLQFIARVEKNDINRFYQNGIKVGIALASGNNWPL